MANEKRLIDANALKSQFLSYVRTEPHFHWGDWQNMCIHGTEIDEVIANAPTVDAVEVVQIEETKQKILRVMDEFIADWLGITQSYTDIFRAKIDAMETAKRLVNAALTDLCDNGGAKMDGGNEDEKV